MNLKFNTFEKVLLIPIFQFYFKIFIIYMKKKNFASLCPQLTCFGIIDQLRITERNQCFELFIKIQLHVLFKALFFLPAKNLSFSLFSKYREYVKKNAFSFWRSYSHLPD